MTVSVIIPVFNGSLFIAACLKSVLAQSYPAMELILVDDGSTDDTLMRIPECVTVLHTGGRRGAGFARNLGATKAKGDVLFFTDADVEVPADWIAKGVFAIKEHHVPCGGGGYAGPLKQVFVQQFAHEELVFRRRKQKGFVQTLVSNNLFCRRDVFEEMGGFPTDYQAASSEDMEFSWNVSRKYKLWWDETNGVYHNYTNTVPLYLRQQKRFARDAVPMLLNNTNLIKGQTHHGKQLYIEVFCTGVIWLGVLLYVITPLICMVGLGGLIAVNGGTLMHMLRARGLSFAVKSVPMIFLRNSAVLVGIAQGLLSTFFVR